LLNCHLFLASSSRETFLSKASRDKKSQDAYVNRIDSECPITHRPAGDGKTAGRAWSIQWVVENGFKDSCNRPRLEGVTSACPAQRADIDISESAFSGYHTPRHKFVRISIDRFSGSED
jgi:hypothetical protein